MKNIKKQSIKEYLENTLENRKTVNRLKQEMKEYIESKYPKQPRFNNWKVGITHDEKERIKGHKSKLQLSELTDFKSFYAYTLKNARTIEEELCTDFKLDRCQWLGKVTLKTKWVYVFNYKRSPKKEKKYT